VLRLRTDAARDGRVRPMTACADDSCFSGGGRELATGGIGRRIQEHQNVGSTTGAGGRPGLTQQAARLSTGICAVIPPAWCGRESSGILGTKRSAAKGRVRQYKGTALHVPRHSRTLPRATADNEETAGVHARG